MLPGTVPLIVDVSPMSFFRGIHSEHKFYPEGNTAGDKFYEGNAIVTGYNISASFDGMVEAELTFTGTGAISLSTAS